MVKKIVNGTRVFIIDKDDRILCIRHTVEDFNGYLDIPGGKVEPGESFEKCAIREVKEETNLDIKNIKYKGIIEIKSYDRLIKFKVYTVDFLDVFGDVKDSFENEAMFLDRKEFLKQKRLSSTEILCDKYINLLKESKKFKLSIVENTEKEIEDIKVYLKGDKDDET